jgi:HJR/Mrr/RecB family endonuclease
MVISNSTYSEVVKGHARSNECVLIDRSILSRWAAK